MVASGIVHRLSELFILCDQPQLWRPAAPDVNPSPNPTPAASAPPPPTAHDGDGATPAVVIAADATSVKDARGPVVARPQGGGGVTAAAGPASGGKEQQGVGGGGGGSSSSIVALPPIPDHVVQVRLRNTKSNTTSTGAFVWLGALCRGPRSPTMTLNHHAGLAPPGGHDRAPGAARPPRWRWRRAAAFQRPTRGPAAGRERLRGRARGRRG